MRGQLCLAEESLEGVNRNKNKKRNIYIYILEIKDIYIYMHATTYISILVRKNINNSQNNRRIRNKNRKN